MAHFAELDENNIVLRVLVVPDEQEHRGSEYLNLDCNIPGRWLQTSINTIGGIHYKPNISNPRIPSEDQNKALRKNYAGVGWLYDEERDAFIAPKLFNSWVLNEETCEWNAPVEYPKDGKSYTWSEEELNWVIV